MFKVESLETIIDEKEIERVRKELMRRRDALINFALDKNIIMEELDRRCIFDFFQNWLIPARPGTIPELMMTFFTCCFSYAPLRKYLSRVAGSIPTPDMLPKCLTSVYDESDFLVEENWFHTRLHTIAQKIQRCEKFDLSSNQFKPRMIRVLLDGSIEMGHRLESGIDSFYEELDEVNKKDGNEIWIYVKEFSKNIHNVGPALICDFLKDIGCYRFVKVDHHFKNEFPELLGIDECHKISPRDHFQLSQTLADRLGMTPFHLDHLLYQWGRYKKYDRR